RAPLSDGRVPWAARGRSADEPVLVVTDAGAVGESGPGGARLCLDGGDVDVGTRAVVDRRTRAARVIEVDDHAVRDSPRRDVAGLGEGAHAVAVEAFCEGRARCEGVRGHDCPRRDDRYRRRVRSGGAAGSGDAAVSSDHELVLVPIDARGWV